MTDFLLPEAAPRSPVTVPIGEHPAAAPRPPQVAPGGRTTRRPGGAAAGRDSRTLFRPAAQQP